MSSPLIAARLHASMLVPTLLGLATASVRGEDQPAPPAPRPATTVPAPAGAAPAGTLTVTGERGSELKPEAAQAVKLDLDLQHTPQSITVMNEDLLRTTGAFSLRDALRSAPGVTMAAGEGGRTGDSLTIRGFQAHSDTYVDGLKDNGQYFRDTFNTQQVEVLKGPSGLLFGRGVTGGAVNLVTKKPSDTWTGDASATVGSESLYRIDGGIGGPVVKDVLAARLDAYYTSSESFRDIELERWGVAPSATWHLLPTTDLTVRYLHQFEDSMMDYGIPVLNRRPAPVSHENYYGFRDDNFQEFTVDMVTATVDHRFDEQFTLRAAGRFADYERFYMADIPGAVTAGLAVPISQSLRLNDQQNTLANLELAYNDTIDQRKLSVAVGADGSWEEYAFKGKDDNPNAANVDLFNPQQPGHNPGAPTGLTGPLNQNNRTRADNYAAYAMLAYEFVKDWTAILGVRVDRFHARFTDGPHVGTGNTPQPLPNPIVREQTDTMVNPRAGLVWDPLPELSLYASYSTSSNPTAETFGLNANADNLDPERTANYEVGAKTELFDRALLLTAAVFRLEKTDMRTPDPNGGPINVLDGEQRTDGVEFGAAGSIAKDWNVFAGYAYMLAEITHSNTAGQGGTTPINAPKHSGSVWITYDLGLGFDVGVGCTATSWRYAGGTQATRLPGYARFDAGAGWTGRTWFARLNVFNLADTEYFDAGSTNYVYPGAPINGQLTVGARF